ncbi:MAG: transcriptional repressor LexA, partial [Candidatus Omnitrophica bacterium]|nr:transcriptional repressor LexA [Candidatus Omnitrophota bacterium]
MLTKRKKQVLEYVKNFIAKRDYAPSLEEIKGHLRLSSVSTAHYHVQALQDMGYLQKEFNQPRALSTIKSGQTIEISIVGTIAAGQPIEAIEAPDETITMPRREIERSGKYYALRVIGNSMIDEGIFDGDIVVIKKQETADNGQTVVAIIDENEATLKKLYKERNRIRLQPANPDLFPIYRKEVEIRGIVIKIIRNLTSPVEKKSAKDIKFKRRIDYSWDYKGAKTKSYTHGLHSYPAMFIPQVARRLLETYSKKGDVICDIFCGSGTALVESRLLNRNTYGIDLNPFAIFLAKVKTSPINPSQLRKEYFNLIDRISIIKKGQVEKPDFMNIDFWFKKNIIYQLAKIKKAIQEIKSVNSKNFFMVSFSETARLSSNSKNGEFKLVRIKGDKLENYNPDVLGIFKKKTEMNIKGMENFYRDVDKNTWAKPIYGDTSKINNIKNASIDCIITSPPYGDSHTTVAYGQFSRLSAQWIDIFENPNIASSVDKQLLGGKTINSLSHSLASSHLKKTLYDIQKRDEKRAREVLSFYIGLNDCIKRAYQMLKKNKYFCLVIGNRMVKQIRIPTDFIIAELGEKIGFTCEDIFVRNIPGKRMPIKNSPTNIAGKLEETMTRE